MSQRTRRLIESALEAVSRLQGRCLYPDGTNYRLDLDCIDDALRRALAEGWPARAESETRPDLFASPCGNCGEFDGVHTVVCPSLFVDLARLRARDTPRSAPGGTPIPHTDATE